MDVIIHETLGIHNRDINTTETEPHTNNITVSIQHSQHAPVASTSAADLPISSNRPIDSMPSLSDTSTQAQHEQIPTKNAYFDVAIPDQPNDLYIAPLQEETTSPIQEKLAIYSQKQSAYRESLLCRMSLLCRKILHIIYKERLS
jgi:hypothetical protein